MKSLVIATDAAQSWHLTELRRAAESLGWRVSHCSLSELWFDTDRQPLVHFPEGVLAAGQELPDLLWVRSIAAGSFEQITFRLGLLRAIGILGVRVINSARAIESCVDKSMTSFLLAERGIAQPPSRTSEDQTIASNWGEESLIAKPLFGAMGKGLRQFTPPELPPESEFDHGVWYIQKLVRTPPQSPTPVFYDYRLLVAGDRCIAAMRRESDHWITNYAQGGSCHPYEPSRREAELAIAAAKAVGADYAGVDIIHNQNHEPLIIEVNSMPAWQGLQSVTNYNIAETLLAKIL
ncbi:MAG: ATP-grasp domain-containing protein [Candidatus Pacebacteria bacterium]|nr:ATP-grasp domain-containing protein [Candidatus Paceibacterota bacterium]